MNSYFILGLFLIISNSLIAQDPSTLFSTDLVLNKQADLESFRENYPNCTEIAGKVKISGGVTDLSALSNITSIHRDLEFSSLYYALDASGLSNLSSLGGNIYIRESKTITDLCTGIMEIPGQLKIENISHSQISGFNALQRVGEISITDVYNFTLPNFIALEQSGSLLIEGNTRVENKFNALKNIYGFLDLKTIDTSISFPALERISHSFTINEMPILLSINGFNNLLEVGGRFGVFSNPRLKEIVGFTNLQHTAIDQTFSISYNDALEKIDGFQNATFTNKETTIQFNDALRIIKGFGGAGIYETNLNISNNRSLVVLDAFNEVEDFKGKIRIASSSGDTFEAKVFQKIKSIEEEIFLDDCDLDSLSFNKLASIAGSLFLSNVVTSPPFENLVEVGGDLYISTRNSLNAFHNLLTVNGEITFVNKSELEVIEGFNKLENVGRIVFPKTGLKVIDGFNAIKTRSTLKFEKFVDLEEVKGFNNLESVGTLSFENNPNLKIIAGFENLMEMPYLDIRSNPELVSLPSFDKVSGEAKISIYVNKLESFVGFNSLEILDVEHESIAFAFFNLKHISGFNSLKKINTSVLFISDKLESIDGFQILEEINGDLVYGALPNLQSALPSFNNLKLVEDITVKSDFPLDNISEFPNLERAHLLRISGLKTLKAFNKLQYSWGLRVDSNPTIETIEGFEQLKNIGSISIENNPLLREISTFDSLVGIDRDLHISYNERLEKCNGFNNLVKINGQIRFVDNLGLKEVIGFNALTSVEEIKFFESHPNLETISGFNALEECSEIILFGKVIEGFNNLKTITNFLLFSGSTTSEINGFGLLQYAKSLYLRPKFLKEVPKFESLTQATNITIGPLDNIETFSSFENLDSVGRLNIHGNKSLLEIQEFPALTSIAQLSISYNEEIKSINIFNNITHIERVSFIENQKLESIKGFESLELMELLQILDNPNLFSLEGFYNVASFPRNDNSEIELSIKDNPLLSFCSLPAICTYILEENKSVISNNALGCNSEEGILEHCDIPKEVQIYTFLDENGNGEYDSNEPNLAGIPLFISPPGRILLSNNTPSLLQSFFGSMHIELLEEREDWNLSSSEVSFTLSLTPDNTHQSVYFGFTPQTNYTSLEPSISAEPFRCNTVISMDLNFKNLGTNTISEAVVYFTVDNRLEQFTFTNQPDIIIDDHKVAWNLSNFYPTEIINEQIQLSIPMVESLGDDRNLNFELELHFTNESGEQIIKESNYVSAVRCSFDPNDKRSLPQKEFKYMSKEKPFHYNIRFQNTGNDVAYDVIILDTISTLLNLSTFELMGTSQPEDLKVYIGDDRQISFEFIGINLIDSLHNEPESHGYISYQIYPVESVIEGDVITNAASIYFDTNLPIHTNKTVNLIGIDEDDDGYVLADDCDDTNATINPGALEILENDIDEDCDGNLITSTLELAKSTINIYPNPTIDLINIDVAGQLDFQVNFYDLHGTLLQTLINVNQLDVKSVIAGMYIIEIKELNSGQKIFNKVFIGN